MNQNRVRFRTGVAACGRVGIPLVIFASPAAMAATPILSVNEFNSSVNGTTATVGPHSQGNATVTPTTTPLSLSNLNNVLTYTGSSQIGAVKNSGNNSVPINSSNTQRVQFSLGLNESANIALTGGYSLSEAVLTASSLSWTLTGPGNVTLFSGGTTVAASGSINEALSNVSGQGTYTLLLTGILNGTASSPNANLATASFSNINFSVTAIPEPASTLLAGVLGMGLIVRRRRSL